MRILHSGPDPDLLMGTSGDDRKTGLHLSDITRRMNYERDRKLNPDSLPEQQVLDRGYTWERILEQALASRHTRPGYRPEQILEDGIWMSPDWVNPDADIQVEEWKSTKKSKNRGFEDISWSWMPNIMAYVRSLARRGVARRLAVRIRLWWINGDYSYEAKTSDLLLFHDYWKVDIEFTKRELEENWHAILRAGVKYGLLPANQDTTWHSKSEKTTATTSPRRRAGRTLLPSTGTRPASTFRLTKTSSKLRAAS